jgi:hypothetical protein
MNFKTLAKHLTEASEAIERLSCGEDGMLPDGTTAHDVLELMEVCQTVAKLIEDESGNRIRFTRLNASEIEDVINVWYAAADNIAARRGE